MKRKRPMLVLVLFLMVVVFGLGLRNESSMTLNRDADKFFNDTNKPWTDIPDNTHR